MSPVPLLTSHSVMVLTLRSRLAPPNPLSREVAVLHRLSVSLSSILNIVSSSGLETGGLIARSEVVNSDTSDSCFSSLCS